MEPYTTSRYKQLAKFQHYRLNIYCCCGESVLTACRVLQPLLLDKDVTFFPIGFSLKWTISRIRSARYLRCRSFRIKCSRQSIQDADEIAKIEKVVTGDTPVQDTYTVWLRLKSQVFDPLERVYGTPCSYTKIETNETDQVIHFNPLKYAAEEYDVLKYARLCHGVVPVFQEWNADYVRRLEQRTQRLVQHIERSAEDCLAAIQDESMKRTIRDKQKNAVLTAMTAM